MTEASGSGPPPSGAPPGPASPSAEDESNRELVGRATRSFLWAGGSLVGSRILSFLAVIALARILVPEEFGVVAAAMTIFIFLEFALDLGLGAALIYEQEHGLTDRVHTAFTMNLLMAVGMAGAFALAAPLVADFFQLSDETQFFRVFSLLIVVKGLSQIPDSIFKRDLEFKRRTIVDLARNAVRLVLAVALALAGFEAWSILWGTLAGELVGVVLSWSLLGFFPRLVLHRRVAGDLLHFGLAVLGFKALDVFATNADYLVVGNQLGPRVLGFYFFAYRLPQLVIGNVYNVFSQVAFPAYSQARELGHARLQRGMLRSLELVTLFGFTAGTGLALVSRDVIAVVLPPEWAPAAAPMALVSIAFGINAIGYASGDIFPAVGRPGLLLKMNLVAAPVLVVALILAAPRGIVAVAAAHLIVSGLYAVVRIVIASRILGLPLRSSMEAMRPAVVVSAGIVAAALPVRALLPPGVASLGAIVTAGLLGAGVVATLFARATVSDLRGLVVRAMRRSPAPETAEA